MKLVIATTAALLAASSFAFAADNNGGKGGKDGTDPATTGSLKGNGLNVDGSSDDAAKCRDGSAGAALCDQPGSSTDNMQQ